MKGAELDQEVQEAEFYAVTLTASSDGRVFFDTQTYWVGWADDSRRHELRAARPVYRDFGCYWEQAGQPYRVIDEPNDLWDFFISGGHALVERLLAERVFERQLLLPDPAVKTWPTGFRSRRLIEEQAFRRAPDPKTRMKVLVRDKRRCRICGRRPEDDTDIQLNVHHIMPWADGGLTELDNLITLCHTCHLGLDPHYDRHLHNYVTPMPTDPLSAALTQHLEGVGNFKARGGLFGGVTVYRDLERFPLDFEEQGEDRRTRRSAKRNA